MLLADQSSSVQCCPSTFTVNREHKTDVVNINVRSFTVLHLVTVDLRDAIATAFTLVFGGRWSTLIQVANLGDAKHFSKMNIPR